VADENNNILASMSENGKKDMNLAQLLTSKEWTEYFNSLSNTLSCEFSVYSDDGSRLFVTKENRFCKFIRSAQLDDLRCPDSCMNIIFESNKSSEPVIFKCAAKQINFALPLERFGEKVFIVGKGEFSSYEDLLEFLKIVRSNNLSGMPVTMPLNLTEESYIEDIAQYVYLTVKRMLNGFEERYRLEEKLIRLASLFDGQAFETLCGNPELMYRYILDTIEFVFGHTSAFLMVLDETRSSYSTIYCKGKLKETVTGFQLDKESSVIQEMMNTKTAVFLDDLASSLPESPLKEIKSSYFFPIFISGTIEGLIGIFDKRFSRDDMKIMNAFMDYIRIYLENRNLRVAATKTKKADEKLASIVDFSNSITSVLDMESLLNALLEKSLQLMNAEQGSLMLLDTETSELVVEARKSVDNVVQEKMRFDKNEGIVGLVLESGGSILVEDIEKDPRIKQQNRPRYKTKSFLSVPIKIEDRVTGVLNVSDKAKGGVFDEDDLNLILSFMNNIAIAIERSLLYKKTEEFKKLSITDPLTGIYNRRYLNSRLSEEITRYNRYKHPFSFLMFDLDRFKEYNDTYGHISGDKLLRTLAHIIEKSLRTIDIAARFGGDEFVAIFPQTPKVDAIQITNRLKEQIDMTLSHEHVEMPLTISMGLATYPDDASSIMELIEKTDQALYLAKKGGGNRVVYL
jgi:diguanylate cyclase (GGDEF)-like protein